jgi:hypothetical protein
MYILLYLYKLPAGAEGCAEGWEAHIYIYIFIYMYVYIYIYTSRDRLLLASRNTIGPISRNHTGKRGIICGV